MRTRWLRTLGLFLLVTCLLPWTMGAAREGLASKEFTPPPGQTSASGQPETQRYLTVPPASGVDFCQAAQYCAGYGCPPGCIVTPSACPGSLYPGDGYCWAGCSPTAGAVILNFWEQNGYSGLVDNMVQAITELHTYMATDPCGYTSPPEIQMYGVENYSLSRGYPFDAELVDSPSFDSFVQEIDAGRPVFVNSSSHAFVIKGYDTNGEWLLVDWNFGNGNNDDWQPFSSLGIVRAITILPPVDVVNDYNNDGEQDVFGILKYGGQSGQTEVHILDGADDFHSFLIHLATILTQVGPDGAWVFVLADYNEDRKPDLYAINKATGQSGMTEVHILNGADNFQSFLVNLGTALHQTGTDGAWMFGLSDYNGDRKPDLYAIDKAGGQSGMTEVHVLNGADNFQSFLTNAATALQQTGTDEAWVFNIGDYNKDRKPDLYAIDKAGGQSGMTEVHILNGADNFQSFLLHAATGLHPSGTDCSWDFATGQCALETPEPTLTVYLPYAVRRLQH